VHDLTFGIIICNDSNYFEPARIMADRGAAALFVPTNNGLPTTKAGPELVAEARNVDIARAIENSVAVIRADVAGRTEGLVSYGSSGIIDRDGMVLQTARQLDADLIVADIQTAPRKRRRGWDASRNGAVMDEYLRLVTGMQPGPNVS
jgi:predicted amidohydrolase